MYLHTDCPYVSNSSLSPCYNKACENASLFSWPPSVACLNAITAFCDVFPFNSGCCKPNSCVCVCVYVRVMLAENRDAVENCIAHNLSIHFSLFERLPLQKPLKSALPLHRSCMSAHCKRHASNCCCMQSGDIPVLCRVKRIGVLPERNCAVVIEVRIIFMRCHVLLVSIFLTLHIHTHTSLFI